MAVLVVLALVATGCGAPADDAEPTLRLDEVTLTSDRVEELDRIRFAGINVQADLSELELVLRTEEAGEFDLLVYLDAEGLFTTVPLHPDTPGQGGSVELQLRSGEQASPVLPLELTGLPDAAGAWEAFIEGFVTELDARARAGGSTLEEVRSRPFEELDGSLAVVRIVAEYVDNGTEEDLESLLESDELAVSVEDRALLDAVVAKLDPLRMIQPAAGLPEFSVSTSTLGPDTDSGHVVAASSVGGIRPLPASDAPAVLAAAQQAQCRTFDLTIDNGDQLADAIATGVGSQIREGGAVDKVMQDAASLGSLVGGVPVIGDLMSIVGAVYGTLALLHNADAGRYPTELAEIDVELDTEAFNEDFTEPGQVTRVMVRAESTGYDAATELSQLATDLIGEVISRYIAGKLSTIGELGGFEEYFIAQADRIRKLLINEVLKQFGNELLTWCSQSWRVDITGATWVKLLGVARLDTNRLQQTYQPNSVGDAMLRVQADPEVFAGRTVSKDVPMRVDRLAVQANPTVIQIDEPGRTVMITAEPLNADTTTLEWDPGPGKWVDSIGIDTNDGRSRPLQTPTDENAYPFDVVVRSTSETGLRANANDERTATIRIELESTELTITPDPGRVQVGGELTFHAIDQYGDPVDVRWEATGGDIDAASGLYVAGDKEGTFTVTATSVDDPEVTATATVIIGEFGCALSFVYDGHGVRPGDYDGPIRGEAAYDTSESTGRDGGGMQLINVNRSGERVPAVHVIMLTDNDPVFAQLALGSGPDEIGIPLGETGTFRFSGGAFLYGLQSSGFFDVEGNFEVTITASEWATFGANEPIPTLFVGTFRNVGPLTYNTTLPESDVSAEVTVLAGSFSFDASVCKSNIL